MTSASTAPTVDLSRLHAAIDADGYATLPAVFDAGESTAILAGLTAALAATQDAAIHGSEGTVYAARNILALWPTVTTLWRHPLLLAALRGVLGPGLGLVRVLYFDKPPGNSWALPWHKDLTIAVRDNARRGTAFSKPTTKAGVPHSEAPEAVLRSMLTARIHLDDVTDENGPLKVIPGSHRDGKALRLDGAVVQTLSATTGDVLLIRPLVAHCSNRSRPDTTQHRRVLHLEFAANRVLPDGFAWHDFVPA